MFRRMLFVMGLLAAVLVFGGGAVIAQGPKPKAPTVALGTGFTYQGQLKSGGAPVNGTCDIAFRLYDAASVGNLIGTAMTPTVPITGGLFTTLLDFGTGAFNGDARWLDMQVSCPSGGAFTALNPRQALTPAPSALALPGLWTQQNGTSPNLIGGYSGNVISATVVGGTIGGGGSSAYPNRVWGDYATVSGGLNNTASGYASTVSGGERSTASGNLSTVSGGLFNSASGFASTVSGGASNTASFQYSTVSGGLNNTASGYDSTVSGGYVNTASGNYSTVSGGVDNTAGGNFSSAAGYRAKANDDGSFVWADSNNFAFKSGATNQFGVRATGGISLVTAIDGSGNPTAGMYVSSAGVATASGVSLGSTGNVTVTGGSISFGATTRQMLNLWGQSYGIGVQSFTEYFRSADSFAWFKQGVHSDAQNDPGAGGTRLMRLDTSGNLYITGTVSSGGADLAERILTSDTPQPGEVVEIDPDRAGQFRLARAANSSAVAGVVSTQPGVRLNTADDGTDNSGVQLALAGRVPVKVSAENGAIKPGDLLVASSTAGHAMRAPANPAPGTIIGKALGKLGDGTGTIEMLVMLR